jgi:hypothetical protein
MGAIGAALVSMVCNLTIGKAKYGDAEEELKAVLVRAEELRRELTELSEEDVQWFGAVMRAYGMPRQTEEESAARVQAIQTALKQATQVPLRCCRACSEIIDLSAVIAEKGNRNVVSDVGIAVLAAHAALRSVFVVYRHDETGLAGEVKTMEVVSLRFEDHGLRSQAVLIAVDADHYRKTLANLYRAIQKSLSCERKSRLRQGGADEGLIGVARTIRGLGD